MSLLLESPIMKRVVTLLTLAIGFLAGTTSASVAASVERTIEFTAPDGVLVVGVVAYPDPAVAPQPERGWPVAVLIHDHGRTADAMLALADALNARGFATIRMDQRGHGQSRSADGRTRIYAFPILPERHVRFETADQQQLVSELARFENLDLARVAFVGAGMGSLVAAEASWRIPGVRALVLVGPVDPVAGFDTRTDIGLYGDRPLLLVCSGFPQSAALADLLAAHGHGERTKQCVESFDTGDRLLTADAPATALVVEWLAKTIPVAR